MGSSGSGGGGAGWASGSFTLAGPDPREFKSLGLGGFSGFGWISFRISLWSSSSDRKTEREGGRSRAPGGVGGGDGDGVLRGFSKGSFSSALRTTAFVNIFWRARKEKKFF